SFAMESAFSLVSRKLFGRDKSWISALVDIGASGTKVTFLQNGKQIYFREQQIGGNQLTQEIVNRYGLSQDEAEADKVSGQLPDGYEQEVLRPFCDLLAMEVSRAMQFFFTSTNYDEVDRIVVSGGCAQLPGLIDAIRARTEKNDGSQVETVVANPFASMSLASGVRFNNLLAAAPSLMVACGLALRRFDA
ncbi:MAG: type IV pilus assembly protein PilM, partial [Rhodocyclaceae bacterium]|nr:type IV pilus assembly protein PilM [Rhodocyclaceae bacterium]